MHLIEYKFSFQVLDIQDDSQWVLEEPFAHMHKLVQNIYASLVLKFAFIWSLETCLWTNGY